MSHDEGRMVTTTGVKLSHGSSNKQRITQIQYYRSCARKSRFTDASLVGVLLTHHHTFEIRVWRFDAHKPSTSLLFSLDGLNIICGILRSDVQGERKDENQG